MLFFCPWYIFVIDWLSGRVPGFVARAGGEREAARLSRSAGRDSRGLALGNALSPQRSQLLKQTEQHPLFPSVLRQEELSYISGVTSVKGKAIN